MSVDYKIKIFRKYDKVHLGTVDANALKLILDSREFATMINCYDGRNCDKASFEVKDLNNITSSIKNKIKEIYNLKIEKKLLVALAQNIEIKRDLEDEIIYLDETIDEYILIMNNTEFIRGMIDCVVESLWNSDNSSPAHEYNCKDIETDNKCKYISVNDVYCEIKAIW